MTKMLNTRRRRACASLLALSFVALLSACGGGGGPDGPGAAQNPAPSPAPAPLPVSNLDASTYVVGLMIESKAGRQFLNIGTAFAVREQLLATNAHVAMAYLEFARVAAASGARVVGASAFQSETGREFQLLRAVVHPTYTGVQSPDVGLLVTREVLPNRLELATPQESAALRKGDALELNGFPGDVFKIGGDFVVGRSVPRANLLKGEVENLLAFSNEVLVNNADAVETYQYSMVGFPGSSGSPVLHGGKVIAVHNAAIYFDALVTQNGQIATRQVATGTGSWGVHVRHLRNLINYFDSGLVAAERNFSLPPPDALIAAPAESPGKSAAGKTYQGTMANPDLPIVDHTLTLTVGQDLKVTGKAKWPANATRAIFPQGAELTLTGTVLENGRITFVDNMPDVVPQVQRGIYEGNLDTATGKFSGHFCEIDAATNLQTHLGNWQIAR
jgi:hypothetical protein